MTRTSRGFLTSGFVQTMTGNRWLFGLTLVVVFALARVATWGYPFDSDHWIFYYVGHNWIVGGGDLYVDAWDHKPPMIFLFNGIMAALFGDNIVLHRIFLTALTVLDVWLFYLVAKRVMPALLAGIRSTIEQMRRLTRELEARDEPIVLVLFGDHKPWMGNGSSVYAEMGVDLDVSTQEGFYNYFSTPYLTYANKAARESLGQDFCGDGGDISPCFLMDKLFFECGWTGDGFMQLQRETRAVTPLMHEDGYRMVDGSITLDVPPDVAEICRRYLCAQYYREQHFVCES